MEPYGVIMLGLAALFFLLGLYYIRRRRSFFLFSSSLLVIIAVAVFQVRPEYLGPLQEDLAPSTIVSSGASKKAASEEEVTPEIASPPPVAEAEQTIPTLTEAEQEQAYEDSMLVYLEEVMVMHYTLEDTTEAYDETYSTEDGRAVLDALADNIQFYYGYSEEVIPPPESFNSMHYHLDQMFFNLAGMYEVYSEAFDEQEVKGYTVDQERVLQNAAYYESLFDEHYEKAANLYPELEDFAEERDWDPSTL